MGSKAVLNESSTRYIMNSATTSTCKRLRSLRQELALTIGLQGESAVRVTPWRQSLPQYLPGHLQRCDQIDACLQHDAPGVTVAGASMRGLGLSACVRQARGHVR